MLGLLGSLSIPIHAKPVNKNKQITLKEAVFYHKKELFPDNETK